MIVPAIPSESLGKYFTIAELQLIFEVGKPKLYKALKTWAEDDQVRLRIYYKPTRGIFVPEVAFHLDDVLTLGTQSGILRVRQEMVDDVVERRAELPPVVPDVLWQHSPRLVARRMRRGPRKRDLGYALPPHAVELSKRLSW